MQCIPTTVPQAVLSVCEILKFVLHIFLCSIWLHFNIFVFNVKASIAYIYCWGLSPHFHTSIQLTTLGFETTHSIMSQMPWPLDLWFSTFYSSRNILPTIILAPHFKPQKKKLFNTPTLYISGKLWGKTYNNSFF